MPSNQPQVNGRYLTPGTEFSVYGERGRFRYISGEDTVVAWGGRKGSEKMRYFDISRIKTVHWTVKTDKGLWEARKRGQTTR